MRSASRGAARGSLAAGRAPLGAQCLPAAAVACTYSRAHSRGGKGAPKPEASDEEPDYQMRDLIDEPQRLARLKRLRDLRFTHTMSVPEDREKPTRPPARMTISKYSVFSSEEEEADDEEKKKR